MIQKFFLNGRMFHLFSDLILILKKNMKLLTILRLRCEPFP